MEFIQTQPVAVDCRKLEKLSRLLETERKHACLQQQHNAGAIAHARKHKHNENNKKQKRSSISS
jgi:hypothetical protein